MIDYTPRSNKRAANTGHLGRYLKAKQNGFEGNFSAFRKAYPMNYRGGRRAI